MLARAHRLVRADDFRRVIRRGMKLSRDHVVCFVQASDSSRFGFIVSNRVGNAPTRNRIKRQLRSVARQNLSVRADIVVRVTPAAEAPTWPELQFELQSCLNEFLSHEQHRPQQ